jgi:hypothetical protein
MSSDSLNGTRISEIPSEEPDQVETINALLPDIVSIETVTNSDDGDYEYTGILLVDGEPVYRTYRNQSRARSILSAVKYGLMNGHMENRSDDHTYLIPRGRV